MPVLAAALVMSLLHTVPARADVPAPNLVANPGFEEATTTDTIPSWTRYPSENLPPETTVSRTDVDQHTGLRSVVLNDTSGELTTGVFSKAFPVEPGATYEAGGSVKLESGSIILYLKFYNAANAQVGQATQTVAGPLGEWTSGTLEGLAPATASYGRFLFYSSTAAITKAYLDDASVTEADRLELPYDFSAPVDLGPAVLNTKTLGGAIGNGEVYFVTNGAPGTFYAIDATTGRINFSQEVAGTTETWAVTVGSDKNVYFASTPTRTMWRYLPDQKKIEALGSNPSDKYVYDLDGSTDGMIYGATFSFYGDGQAFAYDISTGEFTNLGGMYSGENYVRGLGVTDKYLYVGIGAFKHLLRIDRATGVKTEIQLPVTGEAGFIHNIFVHNDIVYVRDGTSIIVVDEKTLEVKLRIPYTDPRTFDGMLSPPSPYDENLLYYRNKVTSALWSYNVQTNTVQPVTEANFLPVAAAKAMDWVAAPDGHKVLGILFESGEYGTYDPADGSLTKFPVSLARAGVTLNSIASDGDGKLYLGGYMDGASVFDEEQQKYLFQGSTPFAPHQVEHTGFLNGKAYFGAYPEGRIYRYDPAKPYDYGETPDHNPGLAYTVPDHQGRPFAFATGDDKLFVGTVPAYSYEGGSVTTYDEATDTWTSTRNVVQNQSISALAYRSGILYGGTSTYGGLGVDNSTTVAHLFKWDVAKGQKIGQEFVPDIPGMAVPELLGGLSFGPDGLLWGAAYGQLSGGGTGFAIYAMDTATNEVTKSTLMYKGTARGNQWREYYLLWGPDGLLYTTIGRYVTAVDPDTLKYRKLVSTSTHIMALGKDGSIYYGNGASLYRLQVPLATASLSVADSTLVEGQTQALVSNGTLANGQPAIMAGSTTTYISSDPSVATVENGVVRAVSRGTTSISAEITLGGKTVRTDPLRISVSRGTRLALPDVTAAYSDLATVSTTLTDSRGTPLPGQSVQFTVAGQAVGQARTDDQGVARYAYQVTEQVANGDQSAEVAIAATFSENTADLYAGSSNTAHLVVTREHARLDYAGSTTTRAGSVPLAAQVIQEADSQLGDLSGLPVKFSVSRVGVDGRHTDVTDQVVDADGLTDSAGLAKTTAKLPTGLYLVRAELRTNGRYAAAHAVTEYVAVTGREPARVQAAGAIMTAPPGSTTTEAQFTVDLRSGEDGPDARAELALRSASLPGGQLHLTVGSTDWLVIDGGQTFLQATARDRQGSTYTVRLLIGQDPQLASLQIWSGSTTTADPIYEQLGREWAGGYHLS